MYRELSGIWQPITHGAGKKIPRGNRPLDCSLCPKVPEETRRELIQLGVRFGPERAIDVNPAIQLLINYHETQAGAPYPSDAFTSRLYGMIHHMVWLEQHTANRQASKTPLLLSALLRG